MKKTSKYKMNLRMHMMQASIMTLIYSCIIALLISVVGMKLFFHGTLTHEVLGILSLLFCVMVVVIDGVLFWTGARFFIKPILEVNDVVTEVAQGNFKVEIQRNQMKNEKYQYLNEIDELSKNVNKMTKELDSMEYMRKDFMRNVSHEVKTPIAAITGFTEILLDGNLSEEEQRDYLEIINKESIRISKLCQNMLSMATLDHQVIVTSKKEIQLDEQLRKCLILVSEKWSDREIEFEIELDPIIIESDADMLQQVWINLIDNAVKYSGEDCKIVVSAKKRADGMVEVAIQDNGIGIEPQKISKIFDAFYQCEESHKTQGNGLGLSIVKRILELLNGTIQCESEEGIGTTMKVCL